MNAPARRRGSPPALLSLIVLALAGCRAALPADALEETWRAQVASEITDDGGARARRSRVLTLFETGRIRGPRASYWAAYVLVTSNEIQTLELARDLAFAAARETGGAEAERALPVAARAVDRLLIRRRHPQRYGTQVAFDAELGRWTLAPIDDRTTDEDRRAMYLPSLAEQRTRAERMNDS